MDYFLRLVIYELIPITSNWWKAYQFSKSFYYTLKGIGLSLDDAIRFFRGEFTKGEWLTIEGLKHTWKIETIIIWLYWFQLRYFTFSLAHIAADKFDKEYTYNIRYNYGKEGKKVNWLPWNCMRYISNKS